MSGGLWSLCARRGRRRTKREDMYTVEPFVSVDAHGNPISLFAVFDGHGGQRAARLASARISELFLSAVEAGQLFPQALKEAFLTIDREITDCVLRTTESMDGNPRSSSPRTGDLSTSGDLSPSAGLQRTSSGSAFATVALQNGDISGMPYGTKIASIDEDVLTKNVSSSKLNNAGGLSVPGAPVVSRRRAKSRADDQLSSVAVRTGQGCGTTATVVALVGNQLFIAHVGDTRAVLSKGNGVVKRLCEDHRPGRKDEMERIESAGGIVVKVRGTYRVNGVLAVSRAIGDVNLKDVVIAMPDVSSFHLMGNEEFVILATDGLWDVMSDEESVEMIRESLTQNDCEDNDDSIERGAVKVLMESAWDRGSNDDVCVLVINLLKYRRVCEGMHDANCMLKTRYDDLDEDDGHEEDCSDGVNVVPLELMTPLHDGGSVTQRRRGEKPW